MKYVLFLYMVIGVVMFVYLVLSNINKKIYWGKAFFVSFFWFPACVFFTIQILRESKRSRKR